MRIADHFTDLDYPAPPVNPSDHLPFCNVTVSEHSLMDARPPLDLREPKQGDKNNSKTWGLV